VDLHTYFHLGTKGWHIRRDVVSMATPQNFREFDVYFPESLAIPTEQGSHSVISGIYTPAASSPRCQAKCLLSDNDLK
jgi:hypothetical protein